MKTHALDRPESLDRCDIIRCRWCRLVECHCKGGQLKRELRREKRFFSCSSRVAIWHTPSANIPQRGRPSGMRVRQKRSYSHPTSTTSSICVDLIITTQTSFHLGSIPCQVEGALPSLLSLSVSFSLAPPLPLLLSLINSSRSQLWHG